MTPGLFEQSSPCPAAPDVIAPGAALLRGFALEDAAALWLLVGQVVAAAPLRRFVTPGGRAMSVEMSNCGALGWISDRAGYRYVARDPLSGQRWPAMPSKFADLARLAAAAAGFSDFRPDACLINSYAPGTRLAPHQDKDESDFSAPIVSVSLGLPAIFLFGTSRRGDRPARHWLAHGDVAVWGGTARLAYHGIAPLADGDHPLTGGRRVNLTFRRTGQAASPLLL